MLEKAIHTNYGDDVIGYHHQALRPILTNTKRHGFAVRRGPDALCHRFAVHGDVIVGGKNCERRVVFGKGKKPFGASLAYSRMMRICSYLFWGGTGITRLAQNKKTCTLISIACFLFFSFSFLFFFRGVSKLSKMITSGGRFSVTGTRRAARSPRRGRPERVHRIADRPRAVQPAELTLSLVQALVSARNSLGAEPRRSGPQDFRVFCKRVTCYKATSQNAWVCLRHTSGQTSLARWRQRWSLGWMFRGTMMAWRLGWGWTIG